MEGPAIAVFDDQETLRLHSIMGDDESTGTYDQMVEEVEKVSALLQETRETLRSTQERLKESEQKSEMLEMKLKAGEQEMELLNTENLMLTSGEKSLREELNRLRLEIHSRPALDHPMNPTLESQWKQAVEFLNKELLDTQEKLERTRINLVTQKNTSEQLERINSQLRNRNNRLGGGSSLLHQHELKEARMQASDLLEENSRLRQQLEDEKKQVEEQKKNIKLNEFAEEKIKFEEREKTTKALTRKLRNEISSEVNAKKDTEATILREQLKRAFKDKEALEDKIRSQGAAVKETERLRREVSRAEFEVSRLHGVIERTREDSEAAINELESKFRMQAHVMQEDQAREKWAKISEMRQQVYQEREHEIIDYQNRMQSLTNETSRLLEQAAIEKEQYGRDIQQSIESTKQAEIDAMNHELTHYRREADALRTSVAHERELIKKEFHDKWEEARQSLEAENESQLQLLVSQVKSLESQCDSLHEEGDEMFKEIKYLREEKKNNSEKLKSFEMNLKTSRGEVYNLKRRNETLRNSIQEYERVVDARDEEIRKNNDLLQRSKMNGSPKLKDREIKHLNGRVETLSLTVQKYKQERARLADQLAKTKKWATGLGTDSKDYFYFLWTAEFAKLERVLKRYDRPCMESKNSFDQPDDEATMDQESKLRHELSEQTIEESDDSLCPRPDAPIAEETSESMKKELQAAQEAVFRLKAEVQKLGSALVIANGLPQGPKDINNDENPVARQVEMNVEEVISELEDFFTLLDATEERSSKHENLLEGLLGAAARESLKICKRIHESDQRCRFFLSQIGEDHKISSKHAALAESSRQENVRISREFQNTLKQLKETLKSLKMNKSGVKNKIDVIKTKFGMHKKRDDIKSNGNIHVGEDKSDSASIDPESLIYPVSSVNNETDQRMSLDESYIEVPLDEIDDEMGIKGENTVQWRQKQSESDCLEMADQPYDYMEQDVENTKAWDVRDDASCESGQRETSASVTTKPITTQALLHLPNRSLIARRFWQEASVDKSLQNAKGQQKKAMITISAASSSDEASDDSVLDSILSDPQENEIREEAVVVTTVYSAETYDSKPFDC